MKITKLGSATVIIKTKKVKILCDPWLTDGAYYGSWCNFPPIDLKKCDLNNIDFIYVSHIHPDHFDTKTMQYLDNSIPVLIHRYHQKFLKANIERLGFEVIELDNGVPFSLSSNDKITIYAADNCDPTICGHMFGCISQDINGSMQLDSLCVIQDENYTLVNTNDCPFEISKQALTEVKKKYKNIDFALIGYTSASLFPHCMMDYSETKMKMGKEIAKNRGLVSGLKTLELLEPIFFMPFAGNYILGGNNFKKNKNLPLPEFIDAIDFFKSKLNIKSIKSLPIMLNLYSSFCLNSKKQSDPYVPIDPQERKSYINKVARYFKYDYENDDYPSNEEILNLFKQSMPRLKKKQIEVSLFEDLNLVFDIKGNNFVAFNLLDLNPKLATSIEHFKNFQRFKIDSRLLKRALLGPHLANWNNIEIGAHLSFSRKPDVFRKDVHTLINSMFV